MNVECFVVLLSAVGENAGKVVDFQGFLWICGLFLKNLLNIDKLGTKPWKILKNSSLKNAKTFPDVLLLFYPIVYQQSKMLSTAINFSFLYLSQYSV